MRKGATVRAESRSPRDRSRSITWPTPISESHSKLAGGVRVAVARASRVNCTCTLSNTVFGATFFLCFADARSTVARDFFTPGDNFGLWPQRTLLRHHPLRVAAGFSPFLRSVSFRAENCEIDDKNESGEVSSEIRDRCVSAWRILVWCL
jgi:hypothetical protein